MTTTVTLTGTSVPHPSPGRAGPATLVRVDDWPLLLIVTPHAFVRSDSQPSVLAPYAGDTIYESQGRRVVEGQRLMQAASDHLLGWYLLESFDGHHREFYVRQLWDGKASVDVARLTPAGLRVYGESCGWTLARGHARSGDRIAMAAYLGHDDSFDRAMADFAARYATTNQADHERLVHAIAAGEIAAREGI